MGAPENHQSTPMARRSHEHAKPWAWHPPSQGVLHRLQVLRCGMVDLSQTFRLAAARISWEHRKIINQHRWPAAPMSTQSRGHGTRRRKACCTGCKSCDAAWLTSPRRLGSPRPGYHGSTGKSSINTDGPPLPCPRKAVGMAPYALPNLYASAASRHFTPSCRGLLTYALIGYAVISSLEY